MAGMETQNTNELLQIRRDKLAELRAAGKDPFTITRYDVTHHSEDVLAHFEELEGKEVSVAGRLMSKRVMGKASFCHVQDLKGLIQCYVARDAVGEDPYKDFKKLDIGDLVGVKGTVFRTKTGETTVHATEVTLLSKSLQILGNNDRYLHSALRMEHNIMDGHYEDALEEASTDGNASMTMLRAYALSRQNELGERLFEYPVSGGSHALLPSKNVHTMLMPDSLIWRNIGGYPRAEVKDVRQFLRVLQRQNTAPETPAVEETPAAPETPAVEETPAAPETPAVEETPAAPETPAVEEAPATPETPAVEETPAAPETPAVEEAPAAPETPAVEEAPAEDPFDVPSETTADEAPAEAPAAPVADAAPAATLTTETTVPATALTPAQTPEAIAAANGVPEGYIYYRDGFYKGDPKKLTVGDVRVSFEYVPATETISLISGQQGDTFAPYQTKYNQIELVEKGVVSADAMFKHAHNANSMICWALRLAGFLMMFFGLKMIFEPLRVVADVVPFIGTIVGMGTGFIAFVLAAGFSLLTISIGWLAYRPLIGVPILIAAIVFLLMPFFKSKKAAPAPETATAPFEK